MNRMEQQIGYAEWLAHTEQDTIRLANQLAAHAAPGAMLALDGDLGAGKTTFSKAFAAAIGVQGIVNSPTFTIIKEYEGKSFPFYHMDVYRVSMEEADELGLDDYFFGAGVTIVEWASLIKELLPYERMEVYMEQLDDGTRRIRLTGIGEPYAGWCEALNEMGETNK